jgi:DNA-binding winged helix-turn-helix (wHTH) protein
VLHAIVPGRFGRSDILVHDARSHEEFGRATSGPDGSSLVWTGPLVIDRWRRVAVLGGRALQLTHREWEMLDYLAAHLDRRCPNAEVTDAIWGPVSWDGGHVLRVVMTRLRAKLVPHEHLIETNPGLGYRLLARPPIEGLTAPASPPEKPWALRFSRCVCCGTTERQHYGHGRCSRCRSVRLARWPHIGPCRAP